MLHFPSGNISDQARHCNDASERMDEINQELPQNTSLVLQICLPLHPHKYSKVMQILSRLYKFSIVLSCIVFPCKPTNSISLHAHPGYINNCMQTYIAKYTKFPSPYIARFRKELFGFFWGGGGGNMSSLAPYELPD